MTKEQFFKGLGMMFIIIWTAFQAGTNIWPVAVVIAIATGAAYFISNLWTVSTSTQGTWNWQDGLKGFLLAIFTFVAASTVTYFNGTALSWGPLILAAISSGVGYLFPTLFSGKPAEPPIPPKG